MMGAAAMSIEKAEKLGADCDTCPLKHLTPVFARNNPKAKLIIMGQEPGPTEVRDGEPFVGESGRMLERALARYGINRYDDCHITNARLCRPDTKLNADDNLKSMLACRGRLHRELKPIKARHILALGALAQRTLINRANIFDWMGGPERGVAFAKKTSRTKKDYTKGELADFSDWLVVPALHPAYCMRQPAYTVVMTIHLGRAWALATGQLKEWKWPKFHTQLKTSSKATTNSSVCTAADASLIAALKRLLRSSRIIAMDVETQGTEPLFNKLMCVGLSDSVTTVSVPWSAYSSKKYGKVASLWECERGLEVYSLVKEILETKKLAFQNGQHDILAMKHQAQIIIPDENFVFDTMLAHAVVAPRLVHGLDKIACMEFHMRRWKTIFGVTSDQKGLAKFIERRELVLRDYNAKDSCGTAMLVVPLKQRLKETHRGEELHARLLAKMKVAMRMTERGIMVHRENVEKHRGPVLRKRNAAHKKLQDVAASFGISNINPNAPKQLHKLFFTKLGVQPTKWSETSGDPSLDESVVNNLLSYTKEPVRYAARYLLHYRRWEKLRSTYIDGVAARDFVHCDWKVHGARTGRWSASPGLQTIPKPDIKTIKRKGKYVKVVVAPGLRDMFCARPGYTLVAADYAQLEMRIAALLAPEPKLLDIFNSGGDCHREVAAWLFNKLPKDITKDERDLAKMSGYQMIYGGSVPELWKKLLLDFPTISYRVVDELHQRFFDIFRHLFAWQERSKREAKERKWVRCPLSGRMQHYPDGNVDVNEVLNFPVQGTGADIIDPAIVGLDADIKGDDNHYILLQVHDEIVGETKKPKEFMRLLKKHMERRIELNGSSVTFPIDYKVGSTWGNMEEVTL